jgi:hypothetical protein
MATTDEAQAYNLPPTPAPANITPPTHLNVTTSNPSNTTLPTMEAETEVFGAVVDGNSLQDKGEDATGTQEGASEAEKQEEAFQTLLRKTVGEGIALTVPITDRDGLYNLREAMGFKTIAARMKSGDKERMDRTTAEQWASVNKFLWGVAHIELFTPEFK